MAKFGLSRPPWGSISVCRRGTTAISISGNAVSLCLLVTVNSHLASLWFGWSLKPINWPLPSVWDAIVGDYQTRGGWIRLHTNAPLHRLAIINRSPKQPIGAQFYAYVHQYHYPAHSGTGGCPPHLSEKQQHSGCNSSSPSLCNLCAALGNPPSSHWHNYINLMNL